MFRATSSVCARFVDTFDPLEKPIAVCCKDEKIEFVDPTGETSTSAEVSGNAGKPTEAPILRKINIVCIVVSLLVIFTTANFALVLQHRTMVFPNSDQLATLENELRVKPEQIKSTVRDEIAKWSADNIPKIKEELKITPIQLEQGIRRAMANMSKRALALIRGICDISYDEKCYWADKSGPKTFCQAELLCQKRGAEAANIYDDEHYNKIVAYLRKKMPPLKTVWLGMTINLTSGITYLRNEDVSNYTLTWYPDYPLGYLGNQLGYHVEKEPSASKQGFFNDFPSQTRHGILCEL